MRFCKSTNIASLVVVLVLGPLLFSVSACSESQSPPSSEINLDARALEWIGQRIFQNECGGLKACLVHWNQGEAFPSLGIGHFIWYPEGVDGPFVESFPAMIQFLSRHGVVLPKELARLEPFNAPWPTREVFLQSSDAPEVQALRDFLMANRGPQAKFLVQRAQTALGRVVNAAPDADRAAVSRHIEALLSTPGGVYALIDYVNFKGEGLSVTERYNGQGWGLLQVLQGMDRADSQPATEGFRKAAASVLTRRAENAAQVIEKQRWLAGWLNRVDTYREPQ